MKEIVWEIAIVILLGIIVAWAVGRIVKKSKCGGGCCGEHAAAEKSVPVRDRNKSHYPYAADLKISGMTCSNCAKRVENALNCVDGVWAKVDIGTNSAHVLLKEAPDLPTLCGIVARAGYTAVPR